MSHQKNEPLATVRKEEEIQQPIPSEDTGFLPIETNWFDRLFISVVIWIALSLFWFRFIEPAGISIWVSNAISLALAYIIIKRG
ncbi:DUF2160 domain-containing protein [Vibrio sp. S9_S30]|uniref:DUF2160 family membrane protein n=1 Tax=Vibrio sp. S9_S30 TaxID=2720226 RepID=UPI00168151DB|nr:DUF2160 family membrane protein [Vibrio sp. S9_S30]MBD1558563.1 DUF2160 domain-containing protein [Vibrio sp. S9_S30]